jgi:hypothetical protein
MMERIRVSPFNHLNSNMVLSKFSNLKILSLVMNSRSAEYGTSDEEGGQIYKKMTVNKLRELDVEAALLYLANRYI